MVDTMDEERIADLQEANSRLRRLLDQRDAPGELRHRLRSTLALLRAIIRRSAGTGRDLESYAAHLEDRLHAITRAQAFADEHGEVPLRALLAEELLQYAVLEGERLLMSGPEVYLQPKAGQVLALALHELAGNAVEHGALGLSGQVEVSWNVVSGEPHPQLCLTWKETGVPPAAPPTHEGFGTEVLTRMLAYDLKAEAQLTYEPDGVCCRISLPVPPRVGRVVLD